MTSKKKICLQISLIILTYLFIEGVCYLGLFVGEKWGRSPSLRYTPVISALSERQKAGINKFIRNPKGQKFAQDPVLGWIETAESNSAGMRDNLEYQRKAPPHIIRLSSFGDSFTYGAGVRLDKTWQKQLSTLNASFEILNYGSGGYGLDQSYLRYLQEGTTYSPHIVFIGFMSENIERNVNVFRPFYSDFYHGNILTKPRFVVSNDKLHLLKNPISTTEDHKRFIKQDRVSLVKLGEHDYHYQARYRAGRFDFLPSVRFSKVCWHVLTTRLIRPVYSLSGMYVKSSEAFRVTAAIFDAFYQKVLENGALPIIVIYPDPRDRRRERQNKPRLGCPKTPFFGQILCPVLAPVISH